MNDYELIRKGLEKLYCFDRDVGQLDCHPFGFTEAITEAIEALNRIQKENEWQLIETAPHDKRVLVWTGQEIYAAHWAQHTVTGDVAWIIAEWGDEGDQVLCKPILWTVCPELPAQNKDEQQ